MFFISFQELEFSNLFAVLHCIHSFFAAKVACLDPLFLGSQTTASAAASSASTSKAKYTTWHWSSAVTFTMTIKKKKKRKENQHIHYARSRKKYGIRKSAVRSNWNFSRKRRSCGILRTFLFWKPSVNHPKWTEQLLRLDLFVPVCFHPKWRQKN